MEKQDSAKITLRLHAFKRTLGFYSDHVGFRVSLVFVAEPKPRALYMVNACSAAELHPSLIQC